MNGAPTQMEMLDRAFKNMDIVYVKIIARALCREHIIYPASYKISIAVFQSE